MKNFFRKIGGTIKAHKVISSLVIVFLLLIIIAATLIIFGPKRNSSGNTPVPGESASADAKYLSNGKCEGDGKPQLTHLPMKESDFSMIIPYGLVVGDHVTPIDHQYFSPTVFDSPRDTYPVYAMADAKLVNIQKRNKPGGDFEYRLVFSMSCKLFYYYDLVTSLTPELLTQMGGKDYAPTDIEIKAGQEIGRIGGQTLDFAVWDMDIVLSGLLVTKSYKAEPWKIHTADPLLYYTEDLKRKALAKYLRTQEPVSGKIDYDIDAKLVGNWFVEGNSGYGRWDGPNIGGHKGHFSFIPDHIDPTHYIFSIGDYEGKPGQFGVKGNGPDPREVGAEDGLVKYELVQVSWLDASGNIWDGKSFAHGLKAKNYDERVEGTALVQLIEKRKLKIEVFPEKKASEVSGFTTNAKIYER